MQPENPQGGDFKATDIASAQGLPNELPASRAFGSQVVKSDRKQASKSKVQLAPENEIQKLSISVLTPCQRINQGWTLCVQVRNGDLEANDFPLECSEVGKDVEGSIGEAVGRIEIEVLSEKIHFCYVWMNGTSASWVENEDVRVVEARPRENISIVDAVGMNCSTSFRIRLNQSLSDFYQRHSFNVDIAVESTRAMLDGFLGIKLRRQVGGRSTDVKGVEVLKLDSADKTTIRSFACRWVNDIVPKIVKHHKKLEICQFCCSILGYFVCPGHEFCANLKDSESIFNHVEQLIGLQTESLQALSSSSRNLIVQGIRVIVEAMMFKGHCGWISLLYAFKDGWNELPANVGLTSPNASLFLDAVKRSGLQRGEFGALAVLRSAPTISVLLEVDVRTLGNSAEVAERLSVVINGECSKGVLVTPDGQTCIAHWLVLVGTGEHPDFNVHELRHFNRLLQSLLRVNLVWKYSCMGLIACILSKSLLFFKTQGLAPSSSPLKENLEIVHTHVASAYPKSKGRTLEQLLGEVEQFWSFVFKVEHVFEEVDPNLTLDSNLPRFFESWLQTMRDGDFISFYCSLLESWKSESGRQLTATARKCLEKGLYSAVKGSLAKKDSIRTLAQLFRRVRDDGAIPRILSTLITEECGISAMATKYEVLNSIFAWEPWTLYLTDQSTHSLVPLLNGEGALLLNRVRAMIADIKSRSEQNSLLIGEVMLLTNHPIAAVQAHFGDAVASNLEMMKTIISEFQSRKHKLDNAFEICSMCKSDCLPMLKKSRDLDPTALTIAQINSMYVIQSKSESDMADLLLVAKHSKIFLNLWQTERWEDVDCSSLAALHQNIWTPVLRKLADLAQRLKSMSIQVGEVRKLFHDFQGPEKIAKELQIVDTVVKPGSQSSQWCVVVARNIQTCFDLCRFKNAAAAITSVVTSLGLHIHLTYDAGFQMLCMLGTSHGADFDAKPLNSLTDKLVEGLQKLQHLTDEQINCLQIIGSNEGLLAWLQEDDTASTEEFGKLIQILTGCVEDLRDLEKLSAINSIHNRLYGLCRLLTSANDDRLFDRTIDQALQLDTSSDLSDKIVQCANELEWFIQLKGKAGKGVGAESIQKMIDFLQVGILQFSVQGQKSVTAPDLSDLRDVRSRVTLLLAPEDHENAEKLGQFGHVLDQAERAERALTALVAEGSARMQGFERVVNIENQLNVFCGQLEEETEKWTRYIRHNRAKNRLINFFSIDQLSILTICATVYKEQNTAFYHITHTDGIPVHETDEMVLENEVHNESSCWTGFMSCLGWHNQDAETGSSEALDMNVGNRNAQHDHKADEQFKTILSLLKCVNPGITVPEAQRWIQFVEINIQNDHWLDGLESALSKLPQKIIVRQKVSLEVLQSVATGKITLVNIPAGSTVEYLLSWHFYLKQEPNHGFVLLCGNSTPLEEALLLVRRAVSPWFDAQAEVFFLAGVERLDSTAQDVVADLLLGYLRRDGEALESDFRDDVRLIVMSEGQCVLANRLFESRHVVRQDAPVLPLPSSYASLQSWAEHVRVITSGSLDGALSSSSGTGKTAQVKRVATAESAEVHAVILHDADTFSVISALQQISENLRKNSKKSGKVLLHLEISSAFIGDIDILLFNMIVLGILKAPGGNVWHRSTVGSIRIELPSGWKPTERSPCRLLHILDREAVPVPPREVLQSADGLMNATPLQKHQHCIQSVHSERLKLDPNVWRNQDFQRVARVLYCYHNNELEQHDPSKIAETPVSARVPSVDGMAAHICLGSILLAIERGTGNENPTWEAFATFWKFLASETLRFAHNQFLIPTIAQQDLPGFRTLILRQILEISRDFVIINGRTDEHPTLSPGQLQRYAPRKVWREHNLSYIIMHTDYFAFFNLRIAPQNEESAGCISLQPRLHAALKTQKVEMNADYNNRPRKLLLRDLAGILDVPFKDIQDPDPLYILTLDNLKKMMAIFLRLRAGLPVIIQGATGCGKTLLVKYMTEFTNAKFFNMRVHGGTTSHDIRKCMLNCEAASRNCKEVIIFFDEVNCATKLDLFKEIICDHRLDGVPLSANVKVIAACNPYVKLSDGAVKKQEAMGLGFSGHDPETLDGIPLRHLVYRVTKLPDSIMQHLWDFGTLTDDVEKLYIQALVDAESGLQAGSPEAQCFAAVIFKSQIFMRQLEDESSFVSLRDYRDRALPSFRFFVDFLTRAKEDISALASSLSAAGNPRWCLALDDSLKSIALALFFSYESRLSDANHRSEYRICMAEELLTNHSKIVGTMQKWTKDSISREFENLASFLQDLLIHEMNLPEGIAKCGMLKENVAMMVICIELNIPLFLVGKPGTSKSLAKKLVYDAMKGIRSTARVFQHFKSIAMFSFQCSPHSTSQDIQSIWDKAVRFLESNDRASFTSVVVLDEIGLAEDSPLMPLKILHPLLEEPEVGFIGLSNWAIDPAKMNRGVSLSRCDPTLEDLVQTARGIAHDALQLHSKLLALTESYLYVYHHCQPKSDFYGLRDFFTMIKMLRHAEIHERREMSTELIQEMVQRNFGGSSKSQEILHTFLQKMPGWTEISLVPIFQSISLIRMCLQQARERGDNSRYLLLQTENSESALQLLYNHAGLRKDEVDVISGSNFPKDQGYSVICGHLRKVRLCMATDRTLVCKDLEACLEALYDLLNQFFTKSLGKKWVDIGLGNERMQCPVGDHFRVIILAKRSQVSDFPIPLLNRLEKHILAIEDILSDHHRGLLETLKRDTELVAGSQRTVSKRGDSAMSALLPGFYMDTIPSLVASMTSYRAQPGQDLLVACHERLLWAATPEYVLRSPNQETQELYFGRQMHNSMGEYVGWVVVKSPNQELRVLITTYDTVPFAGGLRSNLVANVSGVTDDRIQIRYLQDFETQSSFQSALREFKKKAVGSQHNFFILLVAEGVSRPNLIQQVMHMTEGRISSDGNEFCHVVLVLQLNRSLPPARKIQLTFDSSWHWAYVDSLLQLWGPEFPSLLNFWQAGHLSNLFADANPLFMPHVLASSVQAAVGRVHLNEANEAEATVNPLVTIRAIQQLLAHPQLAQALQMRLMHILQEKEARSVSPSAWLEQLVCNKSSPTLVEAGSLSRAVKMYVERLVSSMLTALISSCLCEGGLDMIQSIAFSPAPDVLTKAKQQLWSKIITAGISTGQPLLHVRYRSDNADKDMIGVASYGKAGRSFTAQFPFSHTIFHLINRVKGALRLQGEALLQGVWANLKSNPDLSDVLLIVTSDSLFECYVDDFLRMSYEPSTSSTGEVEYHILSSLLLSEWRRACVRGASFDALESFAFLHTCWVQSEIAQCVANFHTICCYAQAVTFEMRKELPFESCLAIQRSALYHVLQHLQPRSDDVRNLRSWIRNFQGLKSVIADILDTLKRNRIDASQHDKAYRELQVTFLFADTTQSGDWEVVLRFWSRVVAHAEFGEDKTLRITLNFLISEKSGKVKQRWSVFLVKFIHEFALQEFVSSPELHFVHDADTTIKVDSHFVIWSHATELKLDHQARDQLLRILIEVAFLPRNRHMEDLSNGAHNRLQELFHAKHNKDSSAETRRIFVRAAEEVLRMCSQDGRIGFEYAREHLTNQAKKTHVELFGIACIQRCLTQLVDVLFSISGIPESLKPLLAALRHSDSADQFPFRQCREFFIVQALHRYGRHSTCKLGEQGDLSWIQEYLPPSLLNDRVDFFSLHGQPYFITRDNLLNGKQINWDKENPATAMLAVFYKACCQRQPSSLDCMALAGRLLSNQNPCRSAVLDILKGTSCNTLGGSSVAGHYISLLRTSQEQPELGIMLQTLMQHLLVATAFGGPLMQPFKDLLLNPILLADCFLPAMPSFEEQREAMQGVKTTDVKKWYVCCRGHPYAVGNCGQFNASGLCHCGARIGKGAENTPLILQDDPKGFTKSLDFQPAANSILSLDHKKQLQGWDLDIKAVPALRNLTASAVTVLRIFMHVMLLTGALTSSTTAGNAAKLLHLDSTNLSSEAVVGQIVDRICSNLISFRNLTAGSPHDTGILLHTVCQQIIQNAHSESAELKVDLKNIQGRRKWESDFSRMVIDHVIHGAHYLKQGQEILAKWKDAHNRLHELLHRDVNDVWVYKTPITVDLCHRHLQGRYTDPKHLTILRSFLSQMQLLRNLKYLVPITRMFVALFNRYSRRVTSIEARDIKLGDLVDEVEEVNQGLEPFRLAWSSLKEELSSLLPSNISTVLHKALESQRVRLESEKFGKESQLLFFLPDPTTDDGICAFALLIALARLNNMFLELHRRALIERFEVQMEKQEIPFKDIKDENIVSFEEEVHILPLVISYCKHTSKSDGNMVSWDMEAVEEALVRTLLDGRRIIDESSIPQVNFIGKICNASTFGRLRRLGLNKDIAHAFWRSVLAELRGKNAVMTALATLETVMSYLQASTSVDSSIKLVAYLRDALGNPSDVFVTGGACEHVELGQVLCLRNRIDLFTALEQLDNGDDPFSGADADQERLSDAGQELVRRFQSSQSDTEHLLLELRELLTVGMGDIKLQWGLKETLREQLDARDVFIKGFEESFPDRTVLVCHGYHVWKLLGLRAMDMYMKDNLDEAGADRFRQVADSSLSLRRPMPSVLAAPTSRLDLHIEPLNCFLGQSVDRMPKSMPGGEEGVVTFRPQLPAGLVFESGAVRGRPKELWPRSVHIMCVRFPGGTVRAEFILAVLPAPPPKFAYKKCSWAVGVEASCSPTFVDAGQDGAEDGRQGLAAVAYTVQPELPNWLALNRLTGVISGVPEEQFPDTIFAVTCTNEGGSFSTKVQICAKLGKPAHFEYEQLVCLVGVEVRGHLPKPRDSGPLSGAGIQFAVTPDLPAGLTLDARTGAVGGRVDSLPAAGKKKPIHSAGAEDTVVTSTHKVEAKNKAGDRQASLQVLVREPRDILKALRPQLAAQSGSWASTQWSFVAGDTPCRCTLIASKLKIVDVYLNPQARPGGSLYERFAAAHATAATKRVELGFHGTPAENVRAISEGGLDPARRRGQAAGRGEYFAIDAEKSMGYCRGGKRMLLFALIMDQSGLTSNRNGIIVVHKTEFQLPLCEITFQ